MADIIMPLAIDDIAIPSGRREINQAAVKRLADSIDQIGLRHPITVRRFADKYTLVAGLHRIEAHKKLGLEHIPACIVSMSKAEARMWEIAENLHREDLTKLERAEQIEEWRKLAAQLVQQDQHGGHNTRGQTATAEALGVSHTEVQRAEKIAHITDEAKEAAVEAGIDDNQSKLLEVAREAPERQVAKVRELALPKTDEDVIEQQVAAVMNAWNRAGPEARQRVRELIDEPVMDRRFGTQ
jgi:ParB family chromosome partitioning protein